MKSKLLKIYFVSVVSFYTHGLIMEFFLIQLGVMKNYSTKFLIANIGAAILLAAIGFFFSKGSEKR